MFLMRRRRKTFVTFLARSALLDDDEDVDDIHGKASHSSRGVTPQAAASKLTLLFIDCDYDERARAAAAVVKALCGSLKNAPSSF